MSEDSIALTIYTTLESDGRWEKVLATLSRRLSAHAAALAHYDFDTGAGGTLYQYPADGPLAYVYSQKTPVNPWFMSSSRYQPGSIISSPELITTDDFIQTDFYREVLRPRSIFHRMCGVVQRHANHIHYIVLHRKKEQAAFNADDCGILLRLMPHLLTTFGIRARCQTSARLIEIMGCVLHTHLPSIFVVDRNGCVIYQDQETQPSSFPYLGLYVDKGMLMAADATAHRQLREAILRLGTTNEADKCAILELTGNADVPRLRLSLRSITASHQDEKLIVVTISNLKQEEGLALRSFADQFALTPAEERVSALILQGMSPSRVATLLYLSEHTVRSHLKQIFRKTNTHRQAELMNLRGHFF